MKIGNVFLLGIFLAILFSLAACGGAEETTTDSNKNTNEEKVTENTGTEEAGTVDIGFSGPLSGPAAFYGERTLNGVQMAADEINEAGGFEVDGKIYKLNIVSLDDKYLPNETGANAKRLIQQNKTPIIFTPHSGGALAMQVFNQQEKFLIAAYTSEPKVTETSNKLSVRIAPGYDGYIKPFSDYTMDRFGKKIAFLPTATQYGKDWSASLKTYWEKQGGKVVYDSSIDFTKETDFFTVVTNALKDKPDVLFIGGASEPTAKVAKQARELGFKGGFIIMDQAKLEEMQAVTGSYDVLEGAIGVMPLAKLDFPGIPNFLKNFEAKYKETPSYEAGLNYIALNVFVEAMKAAKSVDNPEKIREHIQVGLDNLPAEVEIFDYPEITADGAFLANLVVGAVEDGEIVSIKVD
ncbi:ABC transporter substrate-binding protein [Neobacillus sp. FSL H8-0543]|uniref:ABC transporter substrate-binding protein n=1 Tax=Neobacillus sp. FSL H8-0543 TaxID=2954672 RepID=UPI0031592341